MITDELLFNFKPVVINNIFNAQELYKIYDDRFRIAPESIGPDGSQYLRTDDFFGYVTSTYPPDENMIKRVHLLMQEHIPVKIKFHGLHVARYSLESGSEPKLYPHSDVGLEKASFTLSVQLESSLDWQICVNDDCFSLEKNQGLIFSGTHQVHWRPKVKFSENDFFDIMVYQFIEDSDSTLDITEEHRSVMREKTNDLYISKNFI